MATGDLFAPYQPFIEQAEKESQPEDTPQLGALFAPYQQQIQEAEEALTKYADTAAMLLTDTPPTSVAFEAIAYGTPPEYREAVARRFYDDLKAGKGAGKKLKERRGGLTALNFVQGAMDMFGPLARRAAGVELDPDQIRFKQQLEAIQHGEDPLLSEGLLSKTAQQVARMTVPMVMAVGAGRAIAPVAGGAAGAAGIGARGAQVAATAGTAAGTSGSFYPMVFDQTYEQLIGEGIEPERARTIAHLSAPVEALVESIVPDPLSPGSLAIRGGVRQFAKARLKNALQYGKELSEEAIQGMIRETAMEAGRLTDEHIPNKGLGAIVRQGWESVAESALPLAGLMGPGMTVQTGAELQARRDRFKRYEQLQAIRAKGYVSADDGREAGIEGETRKKRLANADAEIEELEKEIEDARSQRKTEEVHGDVFDTQREEEGEGEVPAGEGGKEVSEEGVARTPLETPDGRSPWQLTRAEHVAERERRIAEFRRLSEEHGGGTEAMKVPDVAEAFRAQEEWSDLDIGHKPRVAQAVREGRDVPASVLAEYPELREEGEVEAETSPVPIDIEPEAEFDEALDELGGVLPAEAAIDIDTPPTESGVAIPLEEVEFDETGMREESAEALRDRDIPEDKGQWQRMPKLLEAEGSITVTDGRHRIREAQRQGKTSILAVKDTWDAEGNVTAREFVQIELPAEPAEAAEPTAPAEPDQFRSRAQRGDEFTHPDFPQTNFRVVEGNIYARERGADFSRPMGTLESFVDTYDVSQAEFVPAAEPTAPDYSGMTLKELQAEAKKRGLKGYSGKRKDAVREMLEAAPEPTPVEEPTVAEEQPSERPERPLEGSEAGRGPEDRGLEERPAVAPEAAPPVSPETLEQAGITLKKTPKGWTVKGISKEVADGLKQDFQGKNIRGGYFFRQDPSAGLADAAQEAIEEAEQTAAAESVGLVRTRIGTLTPEQAQFYEEERRERLAAARLPLEQKSEAIGELVSQFVPANRRATFQRQINRAEDADQVPGFDDLVEYSIEHPELGLPIDEDGLLFELKQGVEIDEESMLEQIDDELAAEIDEWVQTLTPEQARAAAAMAEDIEEQGGDVEFFDFLEEPTPPPVQTAIPGTEEAVAEREQREQFEREKGQFESKKGKQRTFISGLGKDLPGQEILPGMEDIDTPTAREQAAEQAREEGEGGGVAKMAVAPTPTRQTRAARRRAEAEKAGIAAADIQKTVERLFPVAIRQGGFSVRAAGIYKWLTKKQGPPAPEVIRTAEEHYANLAVIAHEVAHHVDEKTKAVKSMPKAVREEVKRLDYEPDKGRDFEGWAEFLRRYIAEPPIDVAGKQIPNPGLDAPKTLAWFENTFLPQNPDVAKPIALFRGYSQQFAQQSVFQRVGTLITDRQPHDLDFKTRWLKKQNRWLHRMKTNFIDKFHTLEWIQEEAQRRGHKGTGIYDMTMAYFLSSTSHATIAFEEGVRSLQTGRQIGNTSLWGLREHLESDAEYEDAVLYALARHTLFMEQKKPGFSTGMDFEDAEALMDEVKAAGKTARFEKFSQDLAQFNNDLLDMLVEAGALAPGDAARMQRYYGEQNYFPLHRVQDVEGSMFAGSGVGFVNLGKPVRGRSRAGSGRQIIDPIDATVAQAIRFYSRAIQARQAHTLAETLDPLMGGVGGMGGLMDRVDPRKKVTQGTVSEILKTLVEEGIVAEDDARDMRIAQRLLNPDIMDPPSDKSLEWFAERHGIEVEEVEEGQEREWDWDALEEAAMDVPDAMAVISLWRPDYSPDAQKRIVRIHDKNGKPLMYEMDPDLYATATGMDDLQFGGFLSTLRQASRYFKTGAVGLSTGFGTANLLRDYWEFQGKARHIKGLGSLGKPPVMLGRYVYEKTNKAMGRKADDRLIRLFEEAGGKVYSIIGHDVHGRRIYRRRRIGKSTMSKLGVSVKRPLDTAEGALQGVQDIIAISDAPPRIADAEAAIKEEGYELSNNEWVEIGTGQKVDRLPEHVRIKAAMAMAEATINFKRVGAKGQYIEAFMPFFNATVQASYRQYRQIKGLKGVGKKDAEGMQAKRYLVYLSALVGTGIAHWLLRHDDDDWRNQEAYLRDGYWTWGDNGKTYARIPKPRDTAIVSNLAENLMDAWYYDDARDTRDVVMRDFQGRLPTGGGLVRGLIETYVADYDYFRERPLTPDYVKNLPKQLQVSPYTSRASDAIGSVTGKWLNTSPIQVEHLLSSASGGLYRRLTDLYDAATDGRLGPEHIPAIRGLVIDRHQARTVNEFYDEIQEADDTLDLQEHEDKVSDDTIQKLAVLKGYAELMTSLRRLERKVGKRRGFEHQPYIVGLARHALGYDEQESNPNPLTDESAPEEVKAVMQEYSRRTTYSASQLLKAKSKYTSDESYESTRRSILRAQAKLKSLDVSPGEAHRLLRAYYVEEEGGVNIKGTGRPKPSFKQRQTMLNRLYANQ